MNRILGFAAALVLVAAIAMGGVLWAQTSGTPGQGRGFGFRPLMLLNYVSRQLNLTADQQQQIKDIVKSRKDDIKALVDSGFAARKALRQAIASGNNDQITAAVNQVSGVELKAAQIRAQIRAKVYSDVLQPDQRTKADQLQAQLDQKADQWRQKIEQFLDSL